MDKLEADKRLEAVRIAKEVFEAEQHLRNIQSNATRARSVTVGSAFNGVAEIMMRGDGGAMLWCVMQPVEVMELIHQLAANIGCHIHVKPRKDFGSWRQWREENAPEHVWLGATHPVSAPPLVNPDTAPGMQPNLLARSQSNEQTVATQKTVGRKRTKRAAAAA